MKKTSLPLKQFTALVISTLLLFSALITPAYGITITPITPTQPITPITPIAPITPIEPGVITELPPLISPEYEFTVANGATTITKYKGTASKIEIPSQLGGSPVRVIGIMAFNGYKTLTDVVIPEGVTTLKDMSFYNCTNLVNVTLPSTLTRLEGESFALCSKLTSIALPDNLTFLDSYAFHGSGLTSITIPKNLTDFYYFHETNNLKSINAAPENPAFASMDGVLYSKDKKNLLQYPPAKPDISFNVPDGVSHLSFQAFSGSRYLQKVTVPASVVLVYGSFRYCKSLTTVEFVGSTTKLYIDCFKGSKMLTNVTLPAKLELIPAETFSDCASLKSIVIPSTVKTIEHNAFSGCINLESINLPDGLKEIQSGTFSGCTALSSIAIPETVELINNYAFYRCSNLSTVTIPSNVAKIGKKAFQSCSNLADARFTGNAPSIGIELFWNTAEGFTIYYPFGKEGWTTPTWYGYPTKGYFAYADLPAIRVRAPITFPIPSTDLKIPPLQITWPDISIPVIPAPAEDEAPDLLPEDMLPIIPILPGPESFYSNASTWAEPELTEANGLGLIPDILIGADMTKSITREEFCELAVLLYEKMTGMTASPMTPNPFADTTNSQILKAYKLGITTGTSATTFSPKTLINREQCATMLFRAIKAIVPNADYSVLGVNDFPDQKDISPWAVDGAKYMSKLGIIKGDTAGNFMPKPITVAQATAGFGMAAREAAILMTVRTYKAMD